jgi:hypothetical protein
VFNFPKVEGKWPTFTSIQDELEREAIGESYIAQSRVPTYLKLRYANEERNRKAWDTLLRARERRQMEHMYSNLPRGTKRKPIAEDDFQRRLKLQRTPLYNTVPRTVGYYKKGVAGEMKYFDTFYDPTAIGIPTTTWVNGTRADPATFLTLCVPQQGAGSNQRIGKEIRIYKIKIRYRLEVTLQATQAGADNGCVIRTLLVQDQQTNATQMAPSLLLSDGLAVTSTLQSFQNVDNFGRFRVLKDKFHRFGNMAVGYNGTTIFQSGNIVTGKFNVNFTASPISVRFNAVNGGTIADIVDNSFHIVCGTDGVALAPTLCYAARVCYKET